MRIERIKQGEGFRRELNKERGLGDASCTVVRVWVLWGRWWCCGGGGDGGAVVVVEMVVLWW